MKIEELSKAQLILTGTLFGFVDGDYLSVYDDIDVWEKLSPTLPHSMFSAILNSRLGRYDSLSTKHETIMISILNKPYVDIDAEIKKLKYILTNIDIGMLSNISNAIVYTEGQLTKNPYSDELIYLILDKYISEGYIDNSYNLILANSRPSIDIEPYIFYFNNYQEVCNKYNLIPKKPLLSRGRFEYLITHGIEGIMDILGNSYITNGSKQLYSGSSYVLLLDTMENCSLYDGEIVVNSDQVYILSDIDAAIDKLQLAQLIPHIDVSLIRNEETLYKLLNRIPRAISMKSLVTLCNVIERLGIDKIHNTISKEWYHVVSNNIFTFLKSNHVLRYADSRQDDKSETYELIDCLEYLTLHRIVDIEVILELFDRYDTSAGGTTFHRCILSLPSRYPTILYAYQLYQLSGIQAKRDSLY